MHDGQAEISEVVLELHAWEIHGGDRTLVAERVRHPDGKRKVIWHVPEAQICRILWLELLLEDDAPSGI